WCGPRGGSTASTSIRGRSRFAACAWSSCRGCSVSRGSVASTATRSTARSSSAPRAETRTCSCTSSAMCGRCSTTPCGCRSPTSFSATSATRTRPRPAPRSSRRAYTEPVAQAPALPGGFELPLEPRLPRIGSVDQVALEERAASLAKRSIKKESKLYALELAVAMGAHEIDMVIDRGAFLSGRYAKVYDEIVRVKEACRDAHLKVILETGELGTYDNVRRASLLAMAAGADFIKTSTGKLPSAATLPV